MCRDGARSSQRAAKLWLALLVQRAAAIRRRNMRFQKVGHALVSVDLIFDPSEAVAFILIDFVFDHAAALLDRVHHLLRFFLGAARIVATRQQIQAAP